MNELIWIPGELLRLADALDVLELSDTAAVMRKGSWLLTAQTERLDKAESAPHDTLRAKILALTIDQRFSAHWRAGYDQARQEVLALLASDASPEPPARIDNGNPYVFCDVVRHQMGCVRGAGHNGPHAFCLPPYPQGPVLLRADASPEPPNEEQG